MQYIQDDYREVDAISRRMTELGIDVLFTLVPERGNPQSSGDKADTDGSRSLTRSPGTCPRPQCAFRSARWQSDRSTSSTADGRSLIGWESLGQEKSRIAQGFLARARETDLAIDIGWREGERIYGRDWLAFVASARATLGTESGASITDFDGSVRRSVEAYLC